MATRKCRVGHANKACLALNRGPAETAVGGRRPTVGLKAGLFAALPGHLPGHLQELAHVGRKRAPARDLKARPLWPARQDDFGVAKERARGGSRGKGARRQIEWA